MSLSVRDLERFGQTALQEFKAQVPRADATDQENERSAERLEAKLEQLYGIAATLAQQEKEITGVAAIWAGMVTVCDEMALAISTGNKRGSQSYDRILDIRNACEENRALHA